jgi:hypothetical protein
LSALAEASGLGNLAFAESAASALLSRDSSGVALVHSGHTVGDPIAAVGSLVILADMLLFGWLVYRREQAELAGQPSPAPVGQAELTRGA